MASYARIFFGIFMIVLAPTVVLGLTGIPQGDNLPGFIIATILYSVGVLLFTLGFKSFRQMQIVENTPTSDISSMAIGNVEIKGNAEQTNKVLEAPLSGEDCLYYRYEVKEHNDDEDGSNWDLKESGEDYVSFEINDGTGTSRVDPEGADFILEEDTDMMIGDHEEPPENIKNFLEQSDKFYMKSGGIISFKESRMYKEWYLAPGEEVYIFGEAEAGEENRRPKIKEGNAPTYIISDESEEELTSRLGKGTIMYLVLGGLISVSMFVVMSLTAGLI